MGFEVLIDFGLCMMLGLAVRNGLPAAPVAPRISRVLSKHGHERVDDYFWLNDRENPDVIAYLEAENAYAYAATSHLEGLRKQLFEEIKGRIKPDDATAPYREKGFYYYARYQKAREYPLFCRRPGTMEAGEEIYLDVNVLAEDHDFYRIGGKQVSPKANLLAFAEDTVGRRIYTIRFKNLSTGEVLADEIHGATGNMAWANDNATLFYCRQDPVTLRSYAVYRHVLGTDPSEDVLVYEETDPTFTARVHKAKSERYIFISCQQTVTSEYRYVDADDPSGDVRIFDGRQRGHEYAVDHINGFFYVTTNWHAKNFRLMKTADESIDRQQWTEVIAHRDDALLEDIELFREYYVLTERHQGLNQVRVRSWDGEVDFNIPADDPAYAMDVGMNPDADTTKLRFVYESMTTPSTVYEFDMATHERTVLKQQEILGGFKRENYRAERVFATAADGTRVPMSIVYRADTPIDGTAPLFVYGYGSYGWSLDASFGAARLSLLDRGFVFAMAHVRGGQELGRQWYDDGRLLNKRNTFTDFIACVEHLLANRYGDRKRVFAVGGSAGGLLMGAVVNMRPDLFAGIVAQVPFVDVLTTMLDESIPLTTGEYDEWGDPNDRAYYDYMLSYSPYDNVDAKAYPNMLVTTGLHDSQVQYWEPAKWVARLRAAKRDGNILLLRTNMEAGHSGVSGRFRQYEETAFEYAFVLDLVGIRE